ncbi:MAG: HEPN domain-containing protein [Planctomycetes bacterium]|nr:HEPN domain-containing protein [Planctomycetota bacterium]
MNALDEVAYRLALAKGFLAEAEQDVGLTRWRSCVDNAQLTVENSGKAILASFGVSPKTHDPAKQVAALLRSQSVRENIREQMQRLLPDLLALGTTEHFLTDYGDEATYTLPWDLFTQEAAADALAAARRTFEQTQELLDMIAAWRRGESSGK